MCGLVAVLSKGGIEGGVAAQTREKMFTQMLFADTLRGRDSTGVFTVTDKGEVNKYKRALSAPDFLQMKAYEVIKTKMIDTRFIVGHNRSATTGDVNDFNAHPFHYNNIIGVHNGTLLWHKNLVEDGSVFDVDSQSIFYALSTRDTEEVLGELTGAFALIWYDTKEKTINLIRNDERPLFLIKIENADTYLVASEHLMAQWVIDRNQYVTENVYEVERGKLYTFHLDSPSEYTEKEVYLAPEQVNSYGYGGYMGFMPGYWCDDHDTDKDTIIKYKEFGVGEDLTMVVNNIDKTKSGVNVSGWVEESLEYPLVKCYINNNDNIDIDSIKYGTFLKGEIKKIENLDLTLKITINAKSFDNVEIKGPGGKEISKEEWDKLTSKGCAICQNNVFENEKIMWTQDKQPICSEHNHDELLGYGFLQ